jgi:hypothetical protein
MEVLYTYSRFHIGSHNENIKELIFKSDLNLSNCEIMTDPFGSNKMRFQYNETFNYKLEIIENNIYKLTITKNNNIDELNKGFFWQTGWSLDLKISFFPLVKNNYYSQENILKLIPYNYGKIVCLFNEKIVLNKYKVGIVMPLFGRYDYTKQCLESLANTNLDPDNYILILVDESLTKDKNNIDNIKTTKLIEDFNLNIPLIKIFKNQHGNMYDSILCGFDILSCFGCEFLMTIDSDTIHKPNWISYSLKTYEDLEKIYSHNFIVVSGFNTLNHPIITNTNNYAIKKDIGGCHMCFKTSIYRKHIRKTLISNKWDTNICTLINNNNGIIATTIPSVIDHIGQISSVRRTKKHSPYDTAQDY